MTRGRRGGRCRESHPAVPWAQVLAAAPVLARARDGLVPRRRVHRRPVRACRDPRVGPRRLARPQPGNHGSCRRGRLDPARVAAAQHARGGGRRRGGPRRPAARRHLLLRQPDLARGGDAAPALYARAPPDRPADVARGGAARVCAVGRDPLLRRGSAGGRPDLDPALRRAARRGERLPAQRTCPPRSSPRASAVAEGEALLAPTVTRRLIAEFARGPLPERRGAGRRSTTSRPASSRSSSCSRAGCRTRRSPRSSWSAIPP
jgi:hypothetical protein